VSVENGGGCQAESQRAAAASSSCVQPLVPWCVGSILATALTARRAPRHISRQHMPQSACVRVTLLRSARRRRAPRGSTPDSGASRSAHVTTPGGPLSPAQEAAECASRQLWKNENEDDKRSKLKGSSLKPHGSLRPKRLTGVCGHVDAGRPRGPPRLSSCVASAGLSVDALRESASDVGLVFRVWHHRDCEPTVAVRAEGGPGSRRRSASSTVDGRAGWTRRIAGGRWQSRTGRGGRVCCHECQNRVCLFCQPCYLRAYRGALCVHVPCTMRYRRIYGSQPAMVTRPHHASSEAQRLGRPQRSDRRQPTLRLEHRGDDDAAFARTSGAGDRLRPGARITPNQAWSARRSISGACCMKEIRGVGRPRLRAVQRPRVRDAGGGRAKFIGPLIDLFADTNPQIPSRDS
jgi:hypothetical protein